MQPSTHWPTLRPPSIRPPRRERLAGAAIAALIAIMPAPQAAAQLTVFDPANHVENALQTARQLQSLTNEAQMLINQARELAASPYSHILQTSQTLRDIAALAGEVRGIAADLGQLEQQFETLYPAAVDGLDPRRALEQASARNANARATAQDLAATAAELERLSQGRSGRLSGALSASEAASGQTAAIQSSTQMLAVLAEDLGAMRAVLLAQSRLMAQDAAQKAADRAAAAEARRQYYSRAPADLPPPTFDPFPNAR